MEIIEMPKTKCGICGCVYSFNKDDFKLETKKIGMNHVNLNVQREQTLYVTCPVCGTSHILYTRQYECDE